MSIRRRKLSNNHNFYSAKRIGEGVSLSYIGSDWMVEKQLYEPRELQFLEYKEDATINYEHFKESLSSENISNIISARQAGVQNEWKTYHFFAQDELNAPRDLFVYINDDGKPDYFTNEQILSIKNWENGDPAPVKGIEMHHMELVSHNKENIGLAATPDNLLAATRQGHITHLHGGNTQNATSPEYFEHSLTTDQQFYKTVEYNRDQMTLNEFENGVYTIGFSTMIFTVISLGIESYRLKDDARPWSEKKRILINTGIVTSTFGMGLSAIGYITKISVDDLFSSFSIPILNEAFTDILAVNSSFLAITITGGLLKYILDIRNGYSREEASLGLKNVMLVATAEFLAFQALGIGLELLADFAKDAIVDSLIPDPTGILIVARGGYNLFKLGKNMINANENKKSVIRCTEQRFEHLYNQALSDLR
jgi:hypothetical protein